MAWSTCIDCGASFESRGRWMQRCWTCWRERKDEEIAEASFERGYQVGYQRGLSIGQNGHRPAPPSRLDPEFLRNLVLLCHPDRHPKERFDLANQATSELLNMLNQTTSRRERR